MEHWMFSETQPPIKYRKRANYFPLYYYNIFWFISLYPLMVLHTIRYDYDQHTHNTIDQLDFYVSYYYILISCKSGLHISICLSYTLNEMYEVHNVIQFVLQIPSMISEHKHSKNFVLLPNTHTSSAVLGIRCIRMKCSLRVQEQWIQCTLQMKRNEMNWFFFFVGESTKRITWCSRLVSCVLCAYASLVDWR